jgi:enoyl-CoA hydratase
MREVPLLSRVENGVAVLKMNRPDALNALSRALRLALVSTLAEMDGREDVRVIILTATGRAFCAGLDVRELEASDANVTDNIEGGDIGGTIAGLKKPVIAAVNGLAVTGGFEITLACDMAIAAESAWFADTHVKIGLLAGWGLSQRLPRLIGPNRAKELALTARRVPAAEAAALGFINSVVPDDELIDRAMALATTIAEWPEKNVANIKAVIDQGYAMPFGEALEHEVAYSKHHNSKVTIRT